MSPWLKVYNDLPGHPKTTRLARKLDIDRATAVGSLVCLWTWASSYAEDGDLSEFGADEIAEAARWSGDPDEFVRALRDTGWLDHHTIHDWDHYTGMYYRDRNRHRKRLQNDTASAESPMNLHKSSSRRREEKRREERVNPPVSPLCDDDDEVLEGEVVTARTDTGGELFDTLFWPFWPTGGSRQMARSRFLAHPADERTKILTAAENYAAAAAAGILRFTVRAEYFVGGQKSYWEEWADGPPPATSNWFEHNGNGATKARQRDLQIAGAVMSVYADEGET